jgi:hypothetical protein
LAHLLHEPAHRFSFVPPYLRSDFQYGLTLSERNLPRRERWAHQEQDLALHCPPAGWWYSS